MAREFDVDVDMHLDFGNTPEGMTIEHVCNRTEEYGWGGRVTVGHMTQLSTLEVPELERITRRLADVGVAVTVLPSTDLYLMGRHQDHSVLRGVVPIHKMLRHGVNCSLSSNNVLNPFTPFGDCSLIRMANLYANVCQVGQIDDTIECFDMVTRRSAELLNLDDYGIEVGKSADLVVIDNENRQGAVAELSQPLMGNQERPRDVPARAGRAPPARAVTAPDLPFEDPVEAFCRHNHVALKGAGDGPLADLTFGAKDVFHIAGARTGFGHPTWLNTHEPPVATAAAVTRLLDAGADLAGKTHTDELAYSLTGENVHYGTPVNARAPDRIPGGSSNGSAAAVTAGLVDFAIGTDCGGSVRLPASYLRHLRHAPDGRPRAAGRGHPVRSALRRRRLVRARRRRSGAGGPRAPGR